MKDVDLTAELFPIMRDKIDLQHALLRGRYMWASAMMENYGVPINMDALKILRDRWTDVKLKLIEKIDVNYGVYEGTVFKSNKFAEYLIKNGIDWELTPGEHLKTDDDYMKEQAKTYPILKPLQELRYSLGQLKLNDLQVGDDGRNRALLSPFGTVTGRNTPSSSKFIFGNAIWLRNLIKPFPGYAISYVDYEQQEIGIAAALSKDENLILAYESGDPYISFAKQAGVVPEDATKETHSALREQFKTCMLGINYGMRETSFARRTGISMPKARELYKMHHNVFRDYWDWISTYMDWAQVSGSVVTRFGWNFNTARSKSGTLQNFPMQGNGADILRVAICLCLENNIRVVAPVHDAILMEATIDNIENDVKIASKLMTEASKHVIDFPLRVEAKIIRYPDHYTDPRGDVMWKSIWEVINE
jgi:DNA polymerase I